MIGVWVVIGAVLFALIFGGYRKLTDGRARRASARAARLDASRLGEKLGATATFVQFSAPVCAPCRVTRRVLDELTADDPALAHIDLDAETRLDLVDEFGIIRTPTVLLLDAEGVVRSRIIGATRRAEVLQALEQLTERAA